MLKYKSPLVCCLVCKSIYSEKGIHSHFIGKHTVIGNKKRKDNGIKSKPYLIKYQNKRKQKYLLDVEKYLLSPSVCKKCLIELPYSKKTFKYCSQSCSASQNNKERTYEMREKQKKSLLKTLSLKPLQYLYPKPKKINKAKSNNPSQLCMICNKPTKGYNKTCSTICHRKVLSITATKNPKMGGNKNTRAHGWYISKFAGKVWLESSYELKVATELDENNINWNRPKPLPYDNKKYYPDFYLPSLNIYLDPKNDYLIKIDQEKIQKVQKQNNVIIFVLNKNNLTWNSIQKIIHNYKINGSILPI